MTRPTRPASTAALKMSSFPMNPAIGGMPPSDSMNTAIATAQPGLRCESPARRSRSHAKPRTSSSLRSSAPSTPNAPTTVTV